MVVHKGRDAVEHIHIFLLECAENGAADEVLYRPIFIEGINQMCLFLAWLAWFRRFLNQGWMKKDGVKEEVRMVYFLGK